jgi:hypothetical protein
MKRKPPTEDPMEQWRYKGDLRTIDGELPHGCPWNRHWYIGQGEPHYPPGSPDTPGHHLPFWTDYIITLIPLNNGKWMARPIKADVLFTVDSPQFDTREIALRKAVAQVIRICRVRARWKAEGPEPWRQPSSDWLLSLEQAQTLITWAMSLLDLPARKLFAQPPEPAPLPLGQLSLFP